MDVLLELKREDGNLKVVVELKQKGMQEKVVSLLEEKKMREAFDLLKDRAEVKMYLPPGRKLSSAPRITLIEDLI